MADTIEARQNVLTRKGAALGMSALEIMQLIQQYGLPLAEALIKLIEARREAAGKVDLHKQLAAAGTSFDFVLIKQLLADLLTTYEKQIIAWVDAGESTIFDALITLVAGSNAVLAAALSKYKDTVIASLDPTVAKAIDDIIAMLKGPATPVEPPKLEVEVKKPAKKKAEEKVEDKA